MIVASDTCQYGDGWTIPCQRWWHEGGKAFFGIPNLGAITDAYLSAYHNVSTTLSEKAREFTLAYDADHITTWYCGSVPPPGSVHLWRKRVL
ncbi:MAG: hypothetical protein ACRDTD_27995 [Pseudonocardiaceae bacterium]